MKLEIMTLILTCLIGIFTHQASGQNSGKTIHVFVALCDNENQGIVPVPPKLGNGDEPRNNLYWGALYGVKTFFERSDDWKLISATQKPKDAVLERCIFQCESSNVHLVADAYKGSEIGQTVIDFLESASGNMPEIVSTESDSQNVTLDIGGTADLVVYVGHNGLMDFQLKTPPQKSNDDNRDVIILACMSKSYFLKPLRKAGANPILWTTGLMSPEAYTLKSAIDGWMLNETDDHIRRRAARAYDKYQKCGLNAALNLFVTDW